MDRRTELVYEAHAREWIANRQPQAVKDGRVADFIRHVRRGALVADLGCGPGWYSEALAAAGLRVVALDVTAAMLAAVAERAPMAARVRGDLAALPLRRGSLDGAWAINTYCHVPLAELRLALADLHHALKPGAPIDLTLPRLDWFHAAPGEVDAGEMEHRAEGSELPGRLFNGISAERARELFTGAGFEAMRMTELDGGFWRRIRARRARTLPDLVRPGLRLLVCGLNPSLYSADLGIPFARPGNRFWPAAVLAGLVERERDARHALARGIGTTDLVKRATPGAAELTRDEYAAGVKRLESLVRACRPAAICFVGLDGWRRAIDRKAGPGWAEHGFAGTPAYLMPSTSGRNARTPLVELAEHLRRAVGGPSLAGRGTS